jgi:hypothetical protein
MDLRHAILRCDMRHPIREGLADPGAEDGPSQSVSAGPPPSSPAARRFAAAGLDRGIQPKVGLWCRRRRLLSSALGGGS